MNTGLCHTSADAIDAAAIFLVETPVEKRLRPTLPLLKERFGLTPVQAIEAIRAADRLRKEVPHVPAS